MGTDEGSAVDFWGMPDHIKNWYATPIKSHVPHLLFPEKEQQTKGCSHISAQASYQQKPGRNWQEF